MYKTGGENEEKTKAEWALTLKGWEDYNKAIKAKQKELEEKELEEKYCGKKVSGVPLFLRAYREVGIKFFDGHYEYTTYVVGKEVRGILINQTNTHNYQVEIFNTIIDNLQPHSKTKFHIFIPNNLYNYPHCKVVKIIVEKPY